MPSSWRYWSGRPTGWNLCVGVEPPPSKEQDRGVGKGLQTEKRGAPGGALDDTVLPGQESEHPLHLDLAPTTRETTLAQRLPAPAHLKELSEQELQAGHRRRRIGG